MITNQTGGLINHHPHILIISLSLLMHVFILRSNPISPDPRVEKIARGLSADGYKVHALGWDRTGKLPRHETMDAMQVTRMAIKARYGTGLMNLPALLIWQIGLIMWLLKHRKSIEVIHACDFDTILPALLHKFLFKTPVIYDIFDFYADHLRRTPELLKQAIRRIDFWAINTADGVIVVDDARFVQIEGSRPKVLISIYNSPEDTPCPPVEEGASQHQNGALRIVYVGLLQVERGIFEMIDVLRNHPDWKLDLAGFGGDEERIVDQIRGMPNISWHGRVQYQHALWLSQQADVLFATYDPAIPNHRYSSPNKIFEGMMLGKPIIVAENTNMDRIINESRCGVVIEYGNRNALENALATLANDRKLREALGQNARRAYEDVYSWQRMCQRLNNFYHQILKKKEQRL
jgi:glycosyltransferase involved in cell wall biosynthesis